MQTSARTWVLAEEDAKRACCKNDEDGSTACRSGRTDATRCLRVSSVERDARRAFWLLRTAWGSLDNIFEELEERASDSVTKYLGRRNEPETKANYPIL